MTVDRRQTCGYYSVGNPFVNEWRAGIWGLQPNSIYEVEITMGDPDGVLNGPVASVSFTTRNDNPAIGTNTRLVSLNGNDAGSGSEADPWRTLQHCADMMVPEMTILVRDGIWQEDMIISNKQGLKNGYITVMPYPGENPILEGSGRQSRLISMTGLHRYIRIKNLTLRNSYFNALDLDSGMTNPPPYPWGDNLPGYHIIEDCHIINPYLMGSGGWEANGLYLRGGVAGVLLQRNLMEFNQSGGSPIYGVAYYRGGPGMIFRENQMTSITSKLKDAIGGGPEDDPYWQHEWDVYKNVSDGNTDDGYQIEGGDVNLRLWENTTRGGFVAIATCPVHGGPAYIIRNVLFTPGPGSQNMVKIGDRSTGEQFFYHNTLLAPSGIDGFKQTDSGLDNLHVKNCIIQVGRYIYELNYHSENLEFDFNLLYTSDGGRWVKWHNSSVNRSQWAALGKDIHSIEARATFVNAASGDLRLVEGSPGIDQGVVLQGFNDQNSPWPFQGAAPDIGAIEGAGTAPPPTAEAQADIYSGPAPLTVQLIGHNSTGAIDSYVWSIDGVETYYVADPVHIFTSEGTHTATLTVTGPGGSNSKNIVIGVTGGIVTHTLTILPGIGGSTQPAAGSYPYPEGENIVVTATPDPTHVFDHWEMNGTNVTDNPVTIGMGSDVTLTPVFVEIITYNLNISSSPGGTTDPIPGVYIFNPGEEVEVQAVPNSGYRFNGWLLNGQPAGENITINIAMNRNNTLQADFQLIPTYSLTIQSATGGSTNPGAGSHDYTENTQVTVTAIPAANYILDHWILNGQAFFDNPIIIEMMADATLTPVFAGLPPDTFNVTITAGEGGETNPVQGAYEVNQGDMFQVKALAYEGYAFDHWEGDIASIANPVSFQVNASISILAVFKEAEAPSGGSGGTLLTAAAVSLPIIISAVKNKGG